MIWLTWRQQRFEMLIIAAILMALATILLVSGLDLRNIFHTMGLASCVHSSSIQCQGGLNTFEARAGTIGTLIAWLNLLPLVLGVLLAAPVVLELESGTYRFSWTQSVPRLRWLTVKVVLVAVLAGGAGLVLGGLITWWRVPIERLDPSGSFQSNDGFDFAGIVPIAYTVYGLALVLCLGTLLRRAVPAIGLALVLFLTARLGVQSYLRPHYLPPVHRLFPVDTAGGNPLAHAGLQHGDWLLTSGFAGRSGAPLADTYVLNLCRGTVAATAKGSESAQVALARCAEGHHIVNYVLYQPANRFWLFQGIESAIFLGLSLVLVAVATFWVRYRIA